MKKHPAKIDAGALTRRDIFRVGTLFAAANLLGPKAAAIETLPGRGKGPNIYEKLGVRPFINCTSTRTMCGGSAALPEVMEAIHEASFYHVHLQELLEKAGPHIAELLRVPAAVVTSGSAGGLTLATLACMAGGDVEILQQVPDTEGVPNEVVAHRWSRSIYDQAVRMTGARMINVDGPEDLARAFGPATIMAFAGREIQLPGSTIPLDVFVKAAHDRGIPVLIDAAADLPQVPDYYLSRGADMVAYSGGKSLKGPQSAGLLLCSRKDLAAAAYRAGAPHHTFARPMKVSKEEVMGLIAAVEALVTTRDLAAEAEEAKRWYRHIIARVTQIPGVTARIIEAPRPGEYPTMEVRWDQKIIGLVAREVGERLLKGEPSVMTHAVPQEADPMMCETNHFLIRPMAMYPGDYKIVAERLYEVLAHAEGPKPKRQPDQPIGNLDGEWRVEIAFAAKKTTHEFSLLTRGGAISGSHRGRIAEGKITGEIDGEKIYLESRGMYEAADMLYFFNGTLTGDDMAGEVGLGEYGKARWKARRIS